MLVFDVGVETRYFIGFQWPYRLRSLLRTGSRGAFSGAYRANSGVMVRASPW